MKPETDRLPTQMMPLEARNCSVARLPHMPPGYLETRCLRCGDAFHLLASVSMQTGCRSKNGAVLSVYIPGIPGSHSIANSTRDQIDDLHQSSWLAATLSRSPAISARGIVAMQKPKTLNERRNRKVDAEAINSEGALRIRIYSPQINDVPAHFADGGCERGRQATHCRSNACLEHDRSRSGRACPIPNTKRGRPGLVLRRGGGWLRKNQIRELPLLGCLGIAFFPSHVGQLPRSWVHSKAETLLTTAMYHARNH